MLAKETVSFDVPELAKSSLAAYERAVGMRPADPKGGDQVRIWYDSVMIGRVTAILVTPEGARRCKLRYDNDGKGLNVSRGRCGLLRRHPAEAAKVIGLLEQIAKLDGQYAACSRVMDGWDGAVSGVIAGRKFEFYIGNNDECEDEASQLINRLSDYIRAAYDPRSAL
ncbi:MAG TPA: hypothetical protein VM146_03200 [Steroidobacteraceae bacterium]|nr:hypothetical protein [Steroidobacteraceae bacterium]